MSHTFGEDSISINVPLIINTALFQNVQIGFVCSVYLNGIENEMTVSIHIIVLWARHGGDH